MSCSCCGAKLVTTPGGLALPGGFILAQFEIVLGNQRLFLANLLCVHGEFIGDRSGHPEIQWWTPPPAPATPCCCARSLDRRRGRATLPATPQRGPCGPASTGSYSITTSPSEKLARGPTLAGCLNVDQGGRTPGRKKPGTVQRVGSGFVIQALVGWWGRTLTRMLRAAKGITCAGIHELPPHAAPASPVVAACRSIGTAAGQPYRRGSRSASVPP